MVAATLAVLATAAMLPQLRSGPAMVATSATVYGATIMAVPAAVRDTTPSQRLAQTLAHWTVFFAAGKPSDHGWPASSPNADLAWNAAKRAVDEYGSAKDDSAG
jgi:hypothetical protein